jgi:hypothetical protein
MSWRCEVSPERGREKRWSARPRSRVGVEVQNRFVGGGLYVRGRVICWVGRRVSCARHCGWRVRCRQKARSLRTGRLEITLRSLAEEALGCTPRLDLLDVIILKFLLHVGIAF